jgi:hypothetical protein
MGLVLFYLRRVLLYDAFVSLAGVAMLQVSGQGVGGGMTLLLQAGIQFLLVLCTFGYPMAVLLYVRLRRREIALYAVAGIRFGSVAAAGYGVTVLMSAVVAAAAVCLARLVGPCAA